MSKATAWGTSNPNMEEITARTTILESLTMETLFSQAHSQQKHHETDLENLEVMYISSRPQDSRDWHIYLHLTIQYIYIYIGKKTIYNTVVGYVYPVPLGRDPSTSFRPSQATPHVPPQGNKALLRAYKQLIFLNKAGY